MSEEQKKFFITLLSKLFQIGQSIDTQAESEEKTSLLYGFLTRQITSINLLLEQIQYNFYILDTIGSKLTGTALTEKYSGDEKLNIMDQILEKHKMPKDEILRNSIILTTQARSQTFNAYLLYFIVTVRTNFEDFTNIIFDTVYPDKELQKRQELEKDIKTTFGQEIDIENPLIKKFIKDRCKEYPFTNKLDLVCKNILNKEEIDGLKDLYNQRNSLHGLGVSKNNEVKHFKKREENHLIVHINKILDLTTECAKKIYDKYTKDHYDLKDITGFEHTYEIKETTI